MKPWKEANVWQLRCNTRECVHIIIYIIRHVIRRIIYYIILCSLGRVGIRLP